MKSIQIRIMHVVTTLEIGGLEMLVLNLARFIDREKFILSICSLTPGKALERDFELIGVPVYTFSKKDGVDWILPIKLRKLFKKESIDIVHTHNIAPYIYSMFGVKTRGANALIHTVHSNIINNPRLLLAEKLLARMTPKIIGDCNKVSDFLKYQQNIAPEKIITIYNGIDVQKYNKNIEIQKKREEIGVSLEDNVVTCVANLIPVKNHEMLLYAFNQVANTIPNSKLLLAGDGECRGKLEALVKQLNISNKVLFLGRRGDIPEILKITDVFALASKSEGLPLSVLESLASRVPIVITNVGGNSEIIRDNYCGYLIPSGDINGMAKGIINLLLNKEKALLFGDRGRDLVEEKFSIQRMVRDYEKIYLKVLGMS